MLTLGLMLLAAMSCQKDRQGYCTSATVEHEVAYGRNASLKLNCALGDVVAIELPKGVALNGVPALGNNATFTFRAEESEPMRVLVWPKMPKSVGQGFSPDDLLGNRSNFQLFLDSGTTVMFDLRIGRARRSVQRVVLTFPEREQEQVYIREQLSAQARKLTQEFEEEKAALRKNVVEQSRRRMARAMLDRLHCSDVGERAMRDLLVVRAHRICRVGSETFIWFEVHNRRKDIFHLKEVRIGEDGGDDADVDALIEWKAAPTLEFDDRVHGVAIFAVEGDGARSYVLTVKEDGGAKRVVAVDEVEF